MPQIKSSGVPQLELLPNLKEQPQWLCWFSSLDSDGKFRKKPYPHSDSCSLYEEGVAKYTDQTNWLSYSEAITVQSEADRPLGIGFVLSEEDDFVVLDLDYCVERDSGELLKSAHDLVNQADSYAEFSPSRTGLHIITQGNISHQGWSNQLTGFRLEIYDKFFITVTQDHIATTPKSARQNQELLDNLYQEHSISWPDPKFTSFWPERTE
jgi:primase-polymerase (primpol)-like protein